MEAAESSSSSSSSSPHEPQPKGDSKVVVLPKQERVGILSEAAELGRLTRLNEHVVEAVAGPREEDFDAKDTHKPPTGSIVLTSNFQLAIQEAAEQGKLRRLKPVVIENFREREEQPDHVVSISPFKDDTRISKFLEEERQRKKLETPMERAERNREAMEKVQTLTPKAIQKPHVKANIPLRMREDVAKLAAKHSYDRTHRIQDDSVALKVTNRCQCPHCQNASPYQTKFYKSLQKDQLQRIKSQRNSKRVSSRSSLQNFSALKLGGIAEEDEEEEEVDEKLLKLRKQVEASILEDEKRRQQEEDAQKKADQHANIEAAKAILEKSLFQPKEKPSKTGKVEAIDPDVLYSNTFGKAFAQVSRRIIQDYELNEEEWNQKQLDEQTEQEDLRQLTELYDRQDAGEKVDEERIYELELFDRFRRDAYLSSREQKDLDIYTKRRQRTDRFIEEYEDVMGRLNDGEEIDEHRAYQLEYVVKKRGLSQDLTIAEESAMIAFETQEYMNDGLNPEDFKTSFGLESDDDESDSDDKSEEENVSLHSRASSHDGLADSKRDGSIQKKKPSDVPDFVESSDSDSSDSSSSSHGSLSDDEDSDDSSLSYYEKDELEDLTEYKDLGEEIDMNRYKDLFLFDKWKKGEKLNEKEMGHLNSFRWRRKLERSYRLEFAELVQLQATGQPFDDLRFYLLQLFARRQVGQPLNEQETSDLEAFDKDEARKEEERKQERKAKKEEERKQRRQAKKSVAKDSDSSKDDAGSDDESASSRESNKSNDDGMITIEIGPSIFDHVSRHSHIIAQRNKKYGKSSKPKPAGTSDGDVDDNESGSEGDSSDGSQSDGSDHESNDDQSLEGEKSEAAHSEQNDKDKGPANEKVKDPESEPNDSHSLDGAGSEAPHPEQTSNEAGKDENEDSSFLSPDEFTEYFRLTDDKEKGLDVDEDRLQLLRLIKVWQFGESTMSVEQLFKLDGFRRKRRKARELKKEFATLLERTDKGEDVDEDRMYLLELFARKQVGEQLTEDEVFILEGLEEKEGLTDEEGELPPPKGTKEVMQDGEGEPVLYAIAISDGESLPSTGEVEELEELLERRASQDEIDEKRLYALQLLMKWKNGDGLDTIERNDLASLRYQRRKDRYYKNEFEELLAKGDQGSEVDEDRIYFLQLYARRLLDEYLTYDEVVDLERFESEETLSFEKEEQLVPSKKGEKSSNDETFCGVISNTPVAAPVLEQASQADEGSNHTVPDPWSNYIPTGEAANVGETQSEKSASSAKEVVPENIHEEQSSGDGMKPYSKDGDTALELPTSEDKSEKSASNKTQGEVENVHEEQPSDDDIKIAPPTLPKTDDTTQITSKDFAALNAVPESDIPLQSMSQDFTLLKKTEENISEKVLTRDHDASVATTIPVTEESSQNELQSTDERSAFRPPVFEVIHESLPQEADEGRSTLDDHPPSSDWKDKESAIPEPIMAAMEANANLLKELDAARLATHEARERAGQEAAKRVAAEDNAKYAETEAMRAKVALVAAEQQRRNYVEPVYPTSRNIQVTGSQEQSSNVPESYLSVMAFNTKLLEQLNDTRQAALEATEQAKEEAAKRAVAEETAKKAQTDAIFVRQALTVADQKRELRANQTKEISSEMLKPYMAAMEANAKLLEELDEARKEALHAKSRATEEALKRSAAEEKAKRAEMEAEKATIMLVERGEQRPHDLVPDPWLADPIFNMEIAGLSDDPPTSQGFLAETLSVTEMDLEKRAQERRERAMKVVAERRQRGTEQDQARFDTEIMEKEHREQVRRAVEERKRRKRAAMEARKQQTIERAMQGMNIWRTASNGDEALQAAKRAKELLQAKRASSEASSPKVNSSQKETNDPIPTHSFDHLKSSSQEETVKSIPTNPVDHLGKSTKPVPTHLFNHLKRRLEQSEEDDVNNDPPVRSSNDPPGTATIGERKSGVNRPLHRDPSTDAVADTLVGKVIGKDPREDKKDTERDEITHEDWYSKMEKIAMSHTAEHGKDDIPQKGSNMSPEDWYQEIEALSRDSNGEANADSDMKRAIEEAKRKARATNMQTDNEVDKEVSQDVEAIRRKVMKMSKDEAVEQILRQVSSDAKSNRLQESGIGRPSAFDPDLEPSTGEEATYTIGDLSEGSSAVSGGDYELRSQQASYQNKDSFNKSHRSTTSRSGRKSAPRRKERNQIPRAPPASMRKPAARAKPNRMKNISWRSNPKDSFSDWKVEIKHKETGKVDNYHLHRNILGYGARKSEYFAIQFQEDRVVNGYYETKSPQVTQLDLPAAWADMFPMVLDFLYYNREKTLKLTAHRSCAMYKWAEFLGIPALKRTIEDFYNKNISLKNFGRFMASAVQMKAGPLVVASKHKIGRLVTQQPHQAWRLAPQFLVTVLEANRKDLITKAKNKEVQPQAFQNASCKWSKAICTCASKNKKEVTYKIFSDLTSETAIPVIDSKVALPLLVLDVEFLQKENDHRYSKFQKRCVQSIVKNWDSFRLEYPDQKALTRALQKLPSDVLTEILILSNNRRKSNPQTAI